MTRRRTQIRKVTHGITNTLGATTPASNQSASWNVTPDVSEINGGTATLSYAYGSYSGSLVFNILGNNPSVATVQGLISSYPWNPAQPWYVYQLINRESSYDQFCPPPPTKVFGCASSMASQPHWGSPEGFGLTQFDLTQNQPVTQYQYVIWDWGQNLTAGEGLLQGDITAANASWSQSSLTYGNYLSGKLTGGAVPPYVPPPSDVVEGGPPGGGCVFSYNSGELQEGAHPFSDAIAMKSYNAGQKVPYMQFVGPTAGNFDGHWAFNPYGGNGTDYVDAVCSATQGN